jgi:crotonobetainyl-CoA:carnitine CoA-transferase CaiB-like acyl-CoA transferase
MSAFAGIRVLELSEGMAGPIVGMWFSDFGADVVKVEPPEGDWVRRFPGFITWNRGKRSIVADSSVDADRERVLTLARAADLIIGDTLVLDSYGIDTAEFRASAPQAVVLHIDPYEGEPPWSGNREMSELVMAISGLAVQQSSTQGTPVHMVAPMLSVLHGIWAATCATAALIERERSGHGQSIAVNGMHGFLVMGTMVAAFDPRVGHQPRVFGAAGLSITYTYYETGDGERIFIGALMPKFQLRLLEALGLTHLLDDPRVGGVVSGLQKIENRLWLRDEFERAFASQPCDVWLEKLGELQVPSGRILTREQWFDSEQVRAIGMHQTIEDPQLGTVELAGVPIVLTRTPGRVAGPSPLLGQHTDTVQPWPAPVRRVTIPQAPTGPGPLAGVKVLSLGTFVAGPFGPFLLGELGAEVIKLESLTGDPFREQAFYQNRGMKGLSIDLSKAEGRAVLGKLADLTDVLVENYRPGVAKKLGVDYDTFKARGNDGLVMVSVSGFGEGGPMSDNVAFDALLSAMGGLMAAQGGNDDPVIITLAINDLTTGSLAGLAAVIGLFERERSGLGQREWTSITGATVLLQAGDVVRYEGRPPAPLGADDFAGPSDTDRFYEVADGWVRVKTDKFDWPALAAAGLVTDCGADDGEGVAELTVGLKSLTRDEAVGVLNSAGVPAAMVRTIPDLAADRRLLDAEILHAHRDSQGKVLFYTAGRYAKFSRTQRRDITVAPSRGEHTREILSGAGMSHEVIDRYFAAGVIQENPPVTWSIAPPYR